MFKQSLSNFLFSKFEEKFEEINTVEEPSTMPSTSGFIENETATLPVDDGGGVGVGVLEQENQRECPDAGTSQDFVSGITKIIPDVDVSSYFQAFIKLND